MALADLFDPQHDMEFLLALYAVYLLNGNTHKNTFVSTSTIKIYLSEAAQLETAHHSVQPNCV